MITMSREQFDRYVLMVERREKKISRILFIFFSVLICVVAASFILGLSASNESTVAQKQMCEPSTAKR